MEDLFEILKSAMYQYTHPEALSPRRQQTMMETYGRYVYSFEAVDELVPAKEMEEEEDKE